MPGLPLNRSDIDAVVGKALLDLNEAMNHLDDVRDALKKRGKPDLVAAGYTDIEADDLLAALEDGNQLGQIYRGANSGTLASPKDFRDKFVKLWGVGVR
jgi:hypothetical protein